MKLTTLAWLILVVAGLSCGQVLFKFAGRSLSNADSLVRGFLSPYLVMAVVLYGLVTLVWVWLLSTVDLSRAYPILALTFAVVPMLGALVFGETTGTWYWLGIGLIMIGLAVVQLSS
jgi:drug/metabolite transporter (DMT)-like permease